MTILKVLREQEGIWPAQLIKILKWYMLLCRKLSNNQSEASKWFKILALDSINTENVGIRCVSAKFVQKVVIDDKKAPAQKTVSVQWSLAKLKIGQPQHPPHSPNMVSCNFFYFWSLKLTEREIILKCRSDKNLRSWLKMSCLALLQKRWNTLPPAADRTRILKKRQNCRFVSIV